MAISFWLPIGWSLLWSSFDQAWFWTVAIKAFVCRMRLLFTKYQSRYTVASISVVSSCWLSIGCSGIWSSFGQAWFGMKDLAMGFVTQSPPSLLWSLADCPLVGQLCGYFCGQALAPAGARSPWSRGGGSVRQISGPYHPGATESAPEGRMSTSTGR